MTLSFRVGDIVAVSGEGAGRIVAIDSAVRLILPGESTPSLSVPMSVAEEVLRAPMTHEAATATLARLCQRVTPRDVRTAPALRSSRDARRLPEAQQVELLRLRHRAPKQLYPHEASYLEAAAKPLFAELSAVLDVPLGLVTASIRAGETSLTTGGPKPLPPAPPAPIEGATFLRSFWLGKQALVGASPADAGTKRAKVGTTAGAWHAFRVDTTREEPLTPGSPLPVDALLAVHDEREGDLDLATLSVRAAALTLPANRFGLLDAAALDDPTLGPELLSELRDDEDGYADRGVASSTWEAGKHLVLVDQKPRARAILITRVIG